jgi:hypothetical protein
MQRSTSEGISPPLRSAPGVKYLHYKVDVGLAPAKESRDEPTPMLMCDRVITNNLSA